MKRRTFIQGTAASLAALPLNTVLGQERRPHIIPAGTTVITRQADRINRYNDGKFNPLDASSELLDTFELPRISRESQPEMFVIWKSIFIEPLTFILPDAKLLEDFQAQFVIADAFSNPRMQLAQLGSASGPPSQIVASRWEKSANWSGAYVVPHDGHIFTEVSGGWILPLPTIPYNPRQSHRYIASVWIGLDGQRRYFNSSLPQIGTRHQVSIHHNAVSIDTYAWYQWWLRGLPVQIPTPIPMQLNINDRVTCDIQVKTATTATLSLTKYASSPFMQNVVWSQTVPAPSLNGRQANISGATAEWVVERPTVLGPVPPGQRPRLHLLPKYSDVTFTQCLANAALELGATNTVNDKLHGARFIRMYDDWPDPQRTVSISSPLRPISPLRDTFTVGYVGPL